MFLKLLTIVLLIFSIKSTQSVKVKARIVTGNIAKIGQFPWHVLIKKEQNSTAICGGSLIAANWVLTASECLKYLYTVYLILGTTTRHNPNALKMTSKIFYGHSYYDIAIIKLPRSVKYSAEIQPIALVTPTFDFKNFTKEAEISGFGAYGDKYVMQESLELNYIKLRLVDIIMCHKWQEDEYICAESAKPSGTVCDGDLGGAVVVQDENGKSRQIAVVTTVPKFCDWPVPLVYLQVKPILNWITELTRIKFE